MKAVPVPVLPAHRHLEDVMQLGQRRITPPEYASADLRADTQQMNLEVVDRRQLADKITPMMNDDAWFKPLLEPNAKKHIGNIIQHDFVGQMDVVRHCLEVMRQNKTAIGS